MKDGNHTGFAGRPVLRPESPVAGLDRRNLGPLQVFAQSISGAAPSAAMAATPAIAATTAGPGVFWSFLVATALAALIGSCVGQFTRRMAAAGSLYSLTAKGLGPLAAFASGWALLVGYGLLTMAALVGSGTYLTDLLAHAGLAGGNATVAAFVSILGAVATLCTVRGIRLSAQVVLITEAVSIGLMLLVSGVLIVGLGPPATAPFAGFPGGFGGIAAGVLPALGGFIGFEAAASLGVEARRPFQSVPRAVQWTAALCGGLLLIAAYTQVAGLNHLPGRLAGQPQPWNALAAIQHLSWLPYVLDVGVATSFFACAMAAATSLARVLFSMGRERIAPAAFGAAHARHHTPHVAIVTAFAVTTSVPIVALAAGVAAPLLLISLLNVAVFGYLLAYLLVCLAAPVFLHRIGELTPTPVLITIVVAPPLLIVLAVFTLASSGAPYPWVFAVLAAAGLTWLLWLRAHRPEELRGLGVYDETSAADLFTGRE